MNEKTLRALVEAGAIRRVRIVADGRIVELWDLGQEIPEDSPNALGMF